MSCMVHPNSPSTSSLLKVVMYGWVHVWTAMSSPLSSYAVENSFGFCKIFTPMKKWVARMLFCFKNAYSVSELCE